MSLVHFEKEQFLRVTLRLNFANFAVCLELYRKGREGLAKGRKGPKETAVVRGDAGLVK